MRNVLLLLGLLFLPHFATAAAFCIERPGAAPECMYDDVNECRKRAIQQQGLCNANPLHPFMQIGSGRFCLADSSQTATCVYPDRGACTRDAQRTGGACLDNRPRNAVQPNPYVNDPLVRE